MNVLPEFVLSRPTGRTEAAAQLADGARAIAGGTDLLPNLRRGLEQPLRLVDLTRIDGLDRIELRDGELSIGANATLAQLACHPAVMRHLSALAVAAGDVAGPGHRSAATLGGNLCQDTRCVFYNQSAWWRASNHGCLKRGGDICHVAPQGQRCHAAFSGDLAPVLLAARAEVEIASPSGMRRMPLDALYRDDGAAHLTLSAGEFVAAVHVTAAGCERRSAYRKARVRQAMDFPLAGVAVVLALREGVIAEIGVGCSGTNSRPIALQGLEPFVGAPVDAERLAALAKLVQQQTSPMRSTVTAANYRRQLAAVLARRLVRELAADAVAGSGA
ncbi:MAG: FAD binding domain-containing protein [Burkholderiaceae bacterium]|nr:FAD binding domain-containing protein [Burkholderiaceae bacterium]